MVDLYSNWYSSWWGYQEY